MFGSITLENIFSFKKTNVELRGLNVLIGPNAVGKSNLIEAISLLQAAPVDLNVAILRQGGVRVVCSLAGPVASPIAAIECDKINGEPLQYRLEFSEDAGGFVILREHLRAANKDYFQRVADNVLIGEEPGTISPTQSVFAKYKNPADTTPITRIGYKLERIRIYREFRTTGDAQSRRGVSSPRGKILKAS